MNTKRINIFTYLLLLALVASVSAACMTKIKAETPAQKSVTASSNTADSSEQPPAYQAPKRVSRDIIKTDEKPAAKKQTK